MKPITDFIDRLSLRQRFLLAPALGLVMLGLLATVYVSATHHHATLMSTLANEDLATLDRYIHVTTNLSRAHLAVHTLLKNQAGLTKAKIHEQSIERLDEIYAATDELKKLSVDISNRAVDAERASVQPELLRHLEEYVERATAMVEYAPIDPAYGMERFEYANRHYVQMAQLIDNVLKRHSAMVREHVADQMRHDRVDLVVYGAIGVACFLLLLAISLRLSNVLTSELRLNIDQLVSLGQEVGGAVAVSGTHEVDKLTSAVGAFKGVLLKLREHEASLQAANNSLARARADLEKRVEERTLQLRSTNEVLQEEIEFRRDIEQHLRLYEQVVTNTDDAVIIADANRRIIQVNSAYERITDRKRDQALGQVLYAGGGSEQAQRAHAELWRSVERDGFWTGEVMDYRDDGTSFPCWVTINAVGDTPATRHYVGIARDITTLKENESQLKKLAFYDALTGFPNRALFNDRLDIALKQAQRQQSMVAVLYIDLDRFKYVNDTLGHSAGDRLLVEAARRIHRCVRAADTVARFGGDEFLVLLSTVAGVNEAAAVADRIIAALGEPLAIDGNALFVGASIGISTYPTNGATAAELHMRADLALYEAKRNGRGQYRLYMPDMSAEGSERLSLSVEIDGALQHDEFLLHYQPIITSATGEVEGVEALIRWQKANGTMVSPAKFIPHAEQTGLIKRIDCWVLQQACREVAELQKSTGLALRVSVNLSSVSIQQGDMPHHIKTALSASGLAPALLNIEITETAVIASPAVALTVLEEIAALGVSLSMDDFGTGYSSLTHLTQFPINEIKLDRSFVHSIGQDSTSEELIRSLIDLARRLNLRVVAEGIEERSQRVFLERAQCHLLQGFHLGRPMPASSLTGWLHQADARNAGIARQ
jgi:diguanylate cyclase (GGDEF)-like protein/PAS domain S-box-containing protein